MNIDDLYSLFLKSTGVCTDTRKLREGNVFFALKGPNFNGNAYAQKALDSGASAVVIDEKEFLTGDQAVLVADVLATLQALASHHRRVLKTPIIGITGSNGKTTTKELMAAVLSKKYKTYATRGNFNNHIGVPLSLLEIDESHELAIIEMGANHVGEIAALCKIAEPDFGLITSIGKAHIEGFGSLENIAKAKGELFDFLRQTSGVAMVNVNNTGLMNLAEGLRTIKYGQSGLNVWGKVVGKNPALTIELQNKAEIVQLQTQIIGDYNFTNMLAAAVVGQHFGVPLPEISTAIEGYTPSNNRSQLVVRGKNRIIMDAYNANPTSMRAALENFKSLNGNNKAVFLGDMLELGSASEAEHAAIVSLVEQLDFDTVCFIGKAFKNAAEKKHFPWFASVSEALELFNTLENALILIKASRGLQLEKLLD